MDAGAGTLANDEIDAEIFHGGIEDFFDGGLQAMNFVEKENFLFFERGENGGEIAFAFEERASAGFDGDGEFIGDNLRESGFAEAGRAVEEDVVESFTAVASGFEGDGDIFFDAFLANVFGEGFGTDASVEASVVVEGRAGDDTGWSGHGFFGSEVVHWGERVDSCRWSVDIRYRISDIRRRRIRIEVCAGFIGSSRWGG